MVGRSNWQMVKIAGLLSGMSDLGIFATGVVYSHTEKKTVIFGYEIMQTYARKTRPMVLGSEQLAATLTVKWRSMWQAEHKMARVP